MSETPAFHTYDLGACIAFSHPKGPWGQLSNFWPDFPLRVDGVLLPTTEHLYQACRFPHLPELQARLLTKRSPSAAKMRAHHHKEETRSDWDEVRVPIMRWCLAVKLAQYGATFGGLLLATGDRPLVEVSADDAFWGAVPDGRGARSATGANMLGNLLLEARATLSAPASSESSHDENGARSDQKEWVPAPPDGLGLRLLGHVITGEWVGDQAET